MVFGLFSVLKNTPLTLRASGVWRVAITPRFLNQYLTCDHLSEKLNQKFFRGRVSSEEKPICVHLTISISGSGHSSFVSAEDVYCHGSLSKGSNRITAACCFACCLLLAACCCSAAAASLSLRQHAAASRHPLPHPIIASKTLRILQPPHPLPPPHALEIPPPPLLTNAPQKGQKGRGCRRRHPRRRRRQSSARNSLAAREVPLCKRAAGGAGGGAQEGGARARDAATRA